MRVGTAVRALAAVCLGACAPGPAGQPGPTVADAGAPDAGGLPPVCDPAPAPVDGGVLGWVMLSGSVAASPPRLSLQAEFASAARAPSPDPSCFDPVTRCYETIDHYAPEGASGGPRCARPVRPCAEEAGPLTLARSGTPEAVVPSATYSNGQAYSAPELALSGWAPADRLEVSWTGGVVPAGSGVFAIPEPLVVSSQADGADRLLTWTPGRAGDHVVVQAYFSYFDSGNYYLDCLVPDDEGQLRLPASFMAHSRYGRPASVNITRRTRELAQTAAGPVELIYFTSPGPLSVP